MKSTFTNIIRQTTIYKRIIRWCRNIRPWITRIKWHGFIFYLQKTVKREKLLLISLHRHPYFYRADSKRKNRRYDYRWSRTRLLFKTWTLCISWHRRGCPVVDLSSSFAAGRTQRGQWIKRRKKCVTLIILNHTQFRENTLYSISKNQHELETSHFGKFEE